MVGVSSLSLPAPDAELPCFPPFLSLLFAYFEYSLYNNALRWFRCSLSLALSYAGTLMSTPRFTSALGIAHSHFCRHLRNRIPTHPRNAEPNINHPSRALRLRWSGPFWTRLRLDPPRPGSRPPPRSVLCLELSLRCLDLDWPSSVVTFWTYSHCGCLQCPLPRPYLRQSLGYALYYATSLTRITVPTDPPTHAPR